MHIIRAIICSTPTEDHTLNSEYCMKETESIPGLHPRLGRLGPARVPTFRNPDLDYEPHCEEVGGPVFRLQLPGPDSGCC